MSSVGSTGESKQRLSIVFGCNTERDAHWLELADFTYKSEIIDR